MISFVDYKKLGTLLKDARKDACMSQKEVSEQLQMTYQNLSSWELGKSKIDIDSLIKLCTLYQISYINILNTATDINQSTVENATPEIILTPQEQQLINDFRDLNNHGKEYILTTMHLARQQYKKDSDISNMENKIG